MKKIQRNRNNQFFIDFVIVPSKNPFTISPQTVVRILSGAIIYHFTGVNTPSYAVSPLMGLIIINTPLRGLTPPPMLYRPKGL